MIRFGPLYFMDQGKAGLKETVGIMKADHEASVNRNGAHFIVSISEIVLYSEQSKSTKS